jgi:hypothetical protein
MKPFMKVVLVVLLIPIVLLIASVFLPSHYRVTRSIIIQATPEAMFANINTLRRWPEWTAWTVARYPDMKAEFSGPEAGVGATYAWTGKTSGSGTLKLTRSEPPKRVEYDLDFEHGKFISKGTILLEPSDGAVRVTWSNEGELGWNPVFRYFGLFMDKAMGGDLEQGLRNLKQKSEAKAN